MSSQTLLIMWGIGAVVLLLALILVLVLRQRENKRQQQEAQRDAALRSRWIRERRMQ